MPVDTVDPAWPGTPREHNLALAKDPKSNINNIYMPLLTFNQN